MPERKTGRHMAVLGVLALVVLAYSVLIVQQLLAGILLAGSIFLVYLFWRLIRALERIARALETSEEI